MRVSWFLQKVLTGFLKQVQRTPAGDISPLMNPESDQHWALVAQKKVKGNIAPMWKKREGTGETRGGGCGSLGLSFQRKWKEHWGRSALGSSQHWEIDDTDQHMHRSGTPIEGSTKIYLEMMRSENCTMVADFVRSEESRCVISHTDGWVCSLRERSVGTASSSICFKSLEAQY